MPIRIPPPCDIFSLPLGTSRHARWKGNMSTHRQHISSLRRLLILSKQRCLVRLLDSLLYCHIARYNCLQRFIQKLSHVFVGSFFSPLPLFDSSVTEKNGLSCVTSNFDLHPTPITIIPPSPKVKCGQNKQSCWTFLNYSIKMESGQTVNGD